MPTLPAAELRAAVNVLTDLEWLLAERNPERRRAAAPVLFTDLDDPARVPVLHDLLIGNGVDSEAILRWCSTHDEPVEAAERRLAELTRGAGILRPVVDSALERLGDAESAELLADAERRKAAFTAYAGR